MITNFDRYESLFEDDSKKADSAGDKDVRALYGNVPIRDLTFSMYGELNGDIEIGSSVPLILESPLNEDSLMIDVVNTYYVENILEIFQKINNSKLEYKVEGAEPSQIESLKSVNIMVGTLMSNAIVQWYNDGIPQTQIAQALSRPIRANQTITESTYDDFLLYENRASALSGGLLKLFKSVKNLSKSGKSADDLANSIKSSSKNVGEIESTISRAQRSGAGHRGIPGGRPTMATPNSFGRLSGGSAKESIPFTERFKSFNRNRRERKLEKMEYRSKLMNERSKQASSNSEMKKSRGGFIKRGAKFIWKAAKIGGIAYALYYLFGKKSEAAETEPVRSIFSTLEESMSSIGAMPFSFFSGLATRSASVDGNGPGDFIAAWATSLNKGGILSDGDFSKVIEYLKMPEFDTYCDVHEALSTERQSEIMGLMGDPKEYPSAGLTTMATLSGYAAFLALFESQLYDAEIAKVDKKSDVETAEIRYDAQGKVREYMQPGDHGSDVKLLQTSLKEIGVYTGEINGVYDETLAKLVAGIQSDAKKADPSVVINGFADNKVLDYLTTQVELLSGVIAGEVSSKVSDETLNQRAASRDYIQQMRANLGQY